jgi:hypothetical protein
MALVGMVDSQTSCVTSSWHTNAVRAITSEAESVRN